MTEQIVKQPPGMISDYLERLTALYRDMRHWCSKLGLEVTDGTIELNEEGLPLYTAPSINITRDRAAVAEVVPVGAAIIGARGRVDLIGRMARHAFLFQVGKGPTITIQTVVEGKPNDNEPGRPIIPGIDGDGWYWVEASVRRAKRVDEALFVDLLTDVSDYDFQ